MCIARYDAGTHTQLQLLRAVSHSVSAHTAALITLHVLDDNGSDSGGGFTNLLPPSGWNILAASSTIINDLTVRN